MHDPFVDDCQVGAQILDLVVRNLEVVAAEDDRSGWFPT
jgi:hypothetical protein